MLKAFVEFNRSPLAENVEKMPFLTILKSEKVIQIQNPDRSQNLISWSLAQGLVFHFIWLKSVSNFLRHPVHRRTDGDDRNTFSASLAEVVMIQM